MGFLFSVTYAKAEQYQGVLTCSRNGCVHDLEPVTLIALMLNVAPSMKSSLEVVLICHQAFLAWWFWLSFCCLQYNTLGYARFASLSLHSSPSFLEFHTSLEIRVVKSYLPALCDFSNWSRIRRNSSGFLGWLHGSAGFLNPFYELQGFLKEWNKYYLLRILQNVTDVCSCLSQYTIYTWTHYWYLSSGAKVQRKQG